MKYEKVEVNSERWLNLTPLLNEEFRDVVGYEDRYEVSNYGRVKSLNYNHTKKEKILKQALDKDGYLIIVLCKNNKKKTWRIHRLVCQAFIPNPNNYPCINHLDENKINNCVDNLEFCTLIYNNSYGTRIERSGKSRRKTVLCIELKTIFYGINEVFKQTGICRESIINCCRGKQKTAGGYHWRYINEK